MEKRIIKKVAVLGSGVMGSRIACHFAGIGLQVLLLDIVPKEAVESKKPSERNKIVNDALHDDSFIIPFSVLAVNNIYFTPESAALLKPYFDNIVKNETGFPCIYKNKIYRFLSLLGSKGVVYRQILLIVLGHSANSLIWYLPAFQNFEKELLFYLDQMKRLVLPKNLLALLWCLR